MMIDTSKKKEFQELIKDFYRDHKREMPWRHTDNQYHVLLSEIMLQQTQVPRVLTKFVEFTKVLPTFESLAQASLPTLLRVWQGMGYNRRALYLQQTAKIIVEKHAGMVPKSPETVDSFPGIGAATASAIVTYIYNIPTVFIETNVRRVFLHHFFQDQVDVDDKQLYPLVEATVVEDNPRDWYYALMDYGTYLAKAVENPNRRSKHYTVQSPYQGSDRRIRGIIVKELLKNSLSHDSIVSLLQEDDSRVSKILQGLEKEGFVREEKGKYTIK